jgi:hypothetical protein
VEEGWGEEAGRHCGGRCEIEGETQLVVVVVLMVDVHLSSGKLDCDVVGPCSHVRNAIADLVDPSTHVRDNNYESRKKDDVRICTTQECYCPHMYCTSRNQSKSLRSIQIIPPTAPR